LREQSDLLRDEITATEDELRTAKTNAGIISVEDSDKTFSDQVSTIEQELFQAKAQEAGYQALLKLDSDAPLMDLMQMPSDKLDKYQRLCDRLDLLVRKQNEYVTVLGYKDENTLVKEGKEQIDELKKELTDEYPELATLTTSAMSSGGQASPLAPGGIGGLIPLLTKINILTEQLKQIWMQAADEDMAKSKIVDLQRKKQILEANYQYFATTLEQARIDEVLGPGRLSNISEVDHPSPPYKDLSKFHKMLYQLIGGGVGVGVVLALLLELVLDQRVKRPAEIESKLHLRLFLTIPNFGPGRKNALDRKTPLSLLENSLEASAAAGGGATSPDLPLANTLSLDSNPLLFPYYDTLRDRLISYFENVNLTRKPKLVAVTSTGKGAGVSTIAAGLADALSETGDGRVLLVKMNLEPDAGQSYFNGRPACELDDALLMEKRDDALVQENLYVVEEISRGDKRPRVLPKRFAQLVPKFKASDYDYIIFDMPPVSQTSVTARLAGLVDMTLLVVESEKSNREVVRQAAALLAQSKATVGAVLNKTKKYVPSRLHQNFLEEG
jgi:Mrp family chromosome partitioning ATPase